LHRLFPSPSAPNLSASILVAAVLLAAAVVACVLTARKGAAASIVVLSDLALGVVLAVQVSDFGLFKLYMYVQPFLAAAIAVWLAGVQRRWARVAASIVLVVVVAAQLSTLGVYVEQSRDAPDLHRASDAALLPAFQRALAGSRMPVISVTDNFTLGYLEAASIGERPLYLMSRNLFAREDFFSHSATRSPWRKRVFPLAEESGPRTATFQQNTNTGSVLAGGHCLLALPTGSQTVLNRRMLPEGSPDLSFQDCAAVKNLLVFTVSNLGDSFFLPEDIRAVSLWQLEPDYFVRGKTMSGLGRYVLLELVRPTQNVRLTMDLTSSLRQDGSNLIPPASVLGDRRMRLPVVGRGSARVFSAPLRPRIIGGRPYVLLDMGVDGRFTPVPRPGLVGLWGKSVPLDPRRLTAHVRDMSLVSAAEMEALPAPAEISSFPDDLADENLEYSGIYEDGWVAERSYATLSSTGSDNLVVKADVLPQKGQRLRVLVDGRVVASPTVSGPKLDLQIPIDPSKGRRRVELRWDSARPISEADKRPAAALLTFLGFTPS
jgi:hypothetical protein